jgi:hypothetical protein
MADFYSWLADGAGLAVAVAVPPKRPSTSATTSRIKVSFTAFIVDLILASFTGNFPAVGLRMSQTIQMEVEMPDDLDQLRLPKGVERRLHELLDKQDSGHALTDNERREAEGLADMNDFLSLLRLRSERLGKPTA